jgi:allophanate hydrolase subunit 1
VAEVVGGLASVMVLFDEDGEELDSRLALLAEVVERARSPRPDGDEEGRLVVLSCTFDGPDLAEVADLARCAPEEVIALVTARTLTVAMVGFSPGFAYLSGLPEELRLSHLDPGWMATHRPDRRASLHTVDAPL